MQSILSQMLSVISELKPIVHYFLHFVFPIFIALLFFNKPKGNWKKVYAIFMLCMLIDIDHLWANPIFDATRCSVGFHFLHSYPAIAIYALLLAFKKTRTIAIGLLFHILTDFIDCFYPH